MPGQLLPLRLLRCSSGLLHSPHGGGAVMFRRAFPFKLRYWGLPSKPHCKIALCDADCTARAFSSGAVRSSGGRRKGDFRAGGVGGQAKSLIDDEAELSDWVSDLKMDSFRGLGSEGEDSDGGGSRGKGRGPTREMGRTAGREGRNRERASMQPMRGGRVSSKRGRESESDDDFGSFAGRSQPRSFSNPTRDHTGKGSKSLLDSDFDDDDEDDDKEDFNSRRRGKGDSRSGPSSMLPRRGGRDTDDSRSGPSSMLLRRGGRDSGSGPGVRGRGGPVRNGISSPTAKRGEKGMDLGRGKYPDRKRTAIVTSEDEEEQDSEDFDDESILENGFLSESSGEKGLVAKQDALGLASSFSEPAKGDAALLSKRVSAGKDESYLSNTRFDQCSLSSLSLKGVKASGYERMTTVQEATLPVILKGKDVLAKAKTGTGKTVAFLLPAIEIITKQPTVDRDQRKPPIYVLVICPTRELANQAAMEAEKLLKFHPTIGVQFVTGGTRLALEQKRLQANPCQILVATPGRLRDHIENTSGFATRLMGVKVLVLDEADHLLDMGFRKDIEKIVGAVPKQRQTLLFSATVPEEVRQICHIALRRDHEYINTVEEGSEETHSQVRQNFLIAPLEKQFSLLYHLLTEHISDDVDYKVLVFCTTAMVTKLVADLLGELKLNVREIHSRKPQSYRTRVSDEFRKSKGLILVTSDVSARGVDYPDVTLVVQLGVPSDREQYIHRLGRTGRKGKEGQGILLLAPWEEYFLANLKDLPISKAPLPSVDPDARKKVERALCHVDMKNKESAYQAWLGYYNSNKTISRDKYKLVELANEFSRSMGLDNPPAIPKLVLGKMGLRNVPGLRSK